MLDDQSERFNEAQPSQKLVLPNPLEPFAGSDRNEWATTAFPTEASRDIGGYGYAYKATAPTRHSATHADPVYRFLYISIALVVVACIVILALVGPTVMGMLAQTPSASTANSLSGSNNTHPKLPTPGGGQSSTPTNQPTPTPTATAMPTAIVTSTPILTIQITSVPQFVGNNTDVTVNVMTNQPNSTVQLFVTYNVLPILYNSQPQVTDGNGFAAIPWHVHVFSRSTIAVAHLYVTAHGADGQQAISTPITVQIGGRVGG